MAVESRGDLASRHGSIGRFAAAHSWSYRSDNPTCTRTPISSSTAPLHLPSGINSGRPNSLSLVENSDLLISSDSARNGLEVRPQAAQQPDHLQVAVGLRLQPTAGPHPVQIPVDVQLQQVGGIVPRAPCLFRLRSFEPGPSQVETVRAGEKLGQERRESGGPWRSKNRPPEICLRKRSQEERFLGYRRDVHSGAICTRSARGLC